MWNNKTKHNTDGLFFLQYHNKFRISIFFEKFCLIWKFSPVIYWWKGGGTGGWNKNYLSGKNWKLNLTYQFLPDLATLIWVCSNLIFRILNTVCKSMCIHSFTFNSQFLYELKHKVCLFKSMCGFFHFLFCFVFIKVYILFNKKHGLLDLKMS